MSKIKFKQTVLRATSELVQQGFQPSKPQPASRAVQFYRKLATGVCCYIDFDLKDWPTPIGREFDVILRRRRMENFPTDEIHFEPLGSVLSDLMRYVYGREDVPLNKYWNFHDEESLYQQVTQVQSLLIDYAIGWLIDPLTSDPWRTPPAEQDAFRRVLKIDVMPALQAHGYELHDMTVTDFPLFIKHLQKGLNAIIEFRQSRLLDLSGYRIDVILYRKFGEDPYVAQPPNYHGWLETRLENLLRSTVDFEPSNENDRKYFMDRALAQVIIPWRYVEYTDLQKQMKDILEKLKRYAIPWLENSESENPVIGFRVA
jgi:hypothetical protein